MSGNLFPCGENMVCLKDTLGIDNYRFCRCLPNYIPKENQKGIPAYCVPYNGTVLEDVHEGFENASGQLLPFIYTQNLIIIIIFVLVHFETLLLFMDKRNHEIQC